MKLTTPIILLTCLWCGTLAAAQPAAKQPNEPATRPIKDLKLRKRLEGHEAEVKALAVSVDGKMLASGDETGAIILWNPVTGAKVRALPAVEGAAVLSLSFSPDGRMLAAAMTGGAIRLFDPSNGELLRTITITSLTSARFSQDGLTLLCTRGQVSDDDEDFDLVYLIDPATGRKRGILDVELEYLIDATFSLDGRHVLITGGEALTDVPVDKGGRQRCRLELWELPAGAGNPASRAAQTAQEPTRKSIIAEQPMPLLSPVFSGNSKFIAAACGDWLVWDAASGKQLATMRAPQFAARSCVFSPNNLWIATGAIDSTVALFHTRDFVMDWRHVDDPSLDVNALKFTPSGAVLIAARGKFIDLFQVPGR